MDGDSRFAVQQRKSQVFNYLMGYGGYQEYQTTIRDYR